MGEKDREREGGRVKNRVRVGETELENESERQITLYTYIGFSSPPRLHSPETQYDNNTVNNIDMFLFFIDCQSPSITLTVP